MTEPVRSTAVRTNEAAIMISMIERQEPVGNRHRLNQRRHA